MRGEILLAAEWVFEELILVQKAEEHRLLLRLSSRLRVVDLWCCVCQLYMVGW